MSESTPERLREFRAQYKDYARRNRGARALRLVLLVLAIAGGLWGAHVFLRSAVAGSVVRSGGMAPEQWRSYAVYLEGKDLPAESLRAYERYLELASLTDSERANVCYTMGTLAAEAEDYEKALAYLYQAELLVPVSDLKSEIDKKVVMCLDRLGRTMDLRRELRNRSNAEQTPADLGADETVLVEYGDVVFTNKDLEREIAKLPASARAKLDSTDARLEFLRNLIARRLLVDKALRLELDEDPAIEEQLAAQRDALVVERLIRDRLEEQSEPSPEDVERFYKAEPERFKTADSDEVPPFEQVRDRAAHMLRVEKEQEVLAQLIADTLDERGVKFHADRLDLAEEEAAP